MGAYDSPHRQAMVVAGSLGLLLVAAACRSSGPPRAEPAPGNGQARILDVPSILGATLADVERQLGEALSVRAVSAGALAGLPEGGEVREYALDGYVVGLRVDAASTIRGVQLQGLARDNVPLDGSLVVLDRLNLWPSVDPRTMTGTSWSWPDADGLAIVVTAGSQQTIDTVSVDLAP